MPLYMDRHELPGLTAMDVAEGHKQDLKIQHKYNCRSLTYWYDEKRGTAFCLIEAPDKGAVTRMHNDAHGLIPNQVIEVSPQLVESFLGRIEDPRVPVDDEGILVFNDPAFRTIMVAELKDAALMRAIYTNGVQLLKVYNEIITETVKQYNGNEVKRTDDGLMVSFTTVPEAVECAQEIQERIKVYNSGFPGAHAQVAIGLNAGEPVTGRGDIFGETILFARRLCYVASGGNIFAAFVVKDHYKREKSGNLPNTIKALTPSEESFITQLMDVTERSWDQEDWKVDDFGRQIGLSKAQLYRKMIAVTGFSPLEFINEFRLKKALEFIEKQKGNIAQIAFETGFNNPAYFAKCFRKRFGILPSEYANATA